MTISETDFAYRLDRWDTNGGYSSGPVLLLAALRGVPTLLMEQNTAPGFTNRRLARWVRAAALSYAETLPYFPATGFVSGNPVRREFLRGATSYAPYLSVVNAYNAQNVFVYLYQYGTDSPNRRAISQFPVLPSVGVRIVF